MTTTLPTTVFRIAEACQLMEIAARRLNEAAPALQVRNGGPSDEASLDLNRMAERLYEEVHMARLAQSVAEIASRAV